MLLHLPRQLGGARAMPPLDIHLFSTCFVPISKLQASLLYFIEYLPVNLTQ